MSNKLNGAVRRRYAWQSDPDDIRTAGAMERARIVENRAAAEAYAQLGERPPRPKYEKVKGGSLLGRMFADLGRTFREALLAKMKGRDDAAADTEG